MYDHLFSLLAPDDRVRASAHWQQKSDDKRDAVQRDERLQYAAEK
jgi:hypothetical protein